MGGTRGEPRGVLHALRLELVLLWARVQNVRMSPCGCAEICAGADNCHFTCAHKRHCIRMHMPERAVWGHCICNVNHTGLSECLISMFALLQKTSFIHFVPIICGYFHVIGVGNIYGRFHTLMFYSWIKMGYERGNYLLLSILCTPLEYLIFLCGQAWQGSCISSGV